MTRKKWLGFLSAAPRVSTRLDAEASGPRAHVLGVMHAFEAIGWQVKPFIVGDRLPSRVAGNSERTLTASRGTMLAADIARLTMGHINAWQAWRTLGGQVDWVYERFAVLQSLGRSFQRHKVPWILETNGPFFYEAHTERKSLALTQLARRLEIAAYRQCDVLVCISSALRDLIVREAGINPDKIVVIPNGVDTRRFDPCQHAARRVVDHFTVGFIGALIPWQGLDLLLQAVAVLRDEGMVFHVVIVGDGPARGEWEGLTQALALEQQVHFVGRVAWSEVPSYIAGFDVGYSGQLPMKIGTMYHSPLKLYEYMAMGKPVVASAYEDARSLVEGRSTGFLFQPGDVHNLKNVLQQVYQARSTLSEMGALARQEILERHSWVRRVQELIAQVEEILGRRYVDSK